jgi:chromosome segregation ATPase
VYEVLKLILMSELLKVVDSLENRISKLLQDYSNLKVEKLKIEEEITILNSQQGQFNNELDQWKEKCSSLKLANSMLGSNQHKTETKLKINALVREIDKCITQLSE